MFLFHKAWHPLLHSGVFLQIETPAVHCITTVLAVPSPTFFQMTSMTYQAESFHTDIIGHSIAFCSIDDFIQPFVIEIMSIWYAEQFAFVRAYNRKKQAFLYRHSLYFSQTVVPLL